MRVQYNKLKIMSFTFTMVVRTMEEMERPRGVKMIYAAGGDPFSTVHHIEEKDGTARFATGAIWEIPD